MWFKNLIVYRLAPDWSVTAAELEERCAQRALQSCGPFDMKSRGWVHVLPTTKRYVHTTNGHHLLTLGIEEKLLPGSIIRQVTADRALELEQQQGYPVGRRQMRELKQRVTEELRARALTRRSTIRAWIDPMNGWFVIDATSAGRAETLVETLRDTLGTFPVQLLDVERSPQMAMASWLMLGDAPLRFTIDDDLQLQASDKSKATIRYSHFPLEGKEIRAYLQSGMSATRLGLTWNDRVSFVLTEKLEIKRVEFLHIEKEESGGEADDVSPEERLDMDFALMTGELSRMLADLVQALGGETLKKAAA
ncbi:MAG: recombination-associated protein RdgC [Gammaproteobacteria bacterium]|nr:recombination-associated protein RdgC [Gammaproteobacteria bacterium]